MVKTASRKNRKTRKQRAGRFIAKGTYGCGFYPALKCEGQTEREPGLFSKLMAKSNAEEEFKQHELLAPIDPDQKYLVYPLKMCKPNIEAFNSKDPNNNISECKSISRKSHEKAILMYHNGGPDLSKVNLSTGEYAAFFRDFLQLFEGLKVLHDNNVAHLDIKKANIVHELISSEPPAYRFRYIDFGLSRNVEKKVVYDDIYDSDYVIYPYELRFIQPQFNYYNLTVNSVKKYLNSAYSNTYFTFFYPFDQIDEYYKKDMIDSTHKYYRESYMNLYETSQIKKEDLQKSADIYGLGILLNSIYGLYIGHKWRNDSTILIPKESLSYPEHIYLNKFMDINELEESPTKQWHLRVANEISLPLYKIVKGMMAREFDVRMKIDEALDLYKKLVPKIEELFSKENIEQHLSQIYTHLLPLHLRKINTTMKNKLPSRSSSYSSRNNSNNLLYNSNSTAESYYG